MKNTKNIKAKSKRVKYNVVNKLTGKQESWTGSFSNEDDCMDSWDWYNKHGKQWESEGIKLIRIEYTA